MSATTTDPLRVALLTFGFWPEIQRGGERIVHELGVELLRLGHRPHVITSHPAPPARAIEDGIAITRHWRPPEVALRLRKIEQHLSHLPFSYLSLHAAHKDIAHAFFPTDALASAKWSERTGRPAIFTHTGIPRRDQLSNQRLRIKVLERATRASTAVTVLSKAARENMWRWLGVEARLVYPGVDLSAFELADMRAEQPTIACAAAVDDARKRIPLLLRAFRRVRRSHRSARLLLPRPSDPQLEAQLRTETDGLEFFAPDAQAVSRIFQEAWVSALTSYNEAFGLVLVESLACGTPVVGARDGGVPEIVDRPEIGRLFDGDDERVVARALLEALELAKDPGTASACRSRASEFSRESTARQYESLYLELLER